MSEANRRGEGSGIVGEGHSYLMIPIAFGSLTATFGGIWAKFFGTEHPDATLVVAYGGLVTAFGGVMASIGAQIVALMKLWIESKAEDRRAALERHDLANKLQISSLKIAFQEQQLQENHARILAQNKKIADLEELTKSFLMWKKEPLQVEVDQDEKSNGALGEKVKDKGEKGPEI